VLIAVGCSSGHRIPSEVIAVAVRWYLPYDLSYRDVEQLLAERGVDVGHVKVCRWVQIASAFATARRVLRVHHGRAGPAHEDSANGLVAQQLNQGKPADVSSRRFTRTRAPNRDHPETVTEMGRSSSALP
jgi:hypothetical protein